ncbi:calcium/proton exchanger [Amniculicola lignicola CBS 123094]|uniref:Vacuolar calcium ion transporter n=1 Tax=Amniculicola lignicola CBS 123094 TaxID=1392246 RepID=A0A6A5VW77_9PLEO|nr:calcium/proton exchanger [Amniculicola lignicola CBS 123094]
MGRWALRNWSNILLIFVPLGIMAPRLGFSDSSIFVLNCIAVIPLADVLCRATEDVSSYMGETAGALLNVTMENATEVMIFHALMQRQYMIVRTSLLGSIIANILLVLGLAIFTGEFQLRGQTYNVLATRVATCLMGMATISLLIPSTLRTSSDQAKLARDILDLSRGISVVLIVVYLIYLSTQINSSKFAYKALNQIDPDTPTMDIPAMLFKSLPGVRRGLPIAMLILSAGLISVCGKSLVDSIDHFVGHSMLSKTTIGLIVLPVVGNASELVSAIMLASRKQMDLAFAVSIGSAIQIALFVTPLVVLMGWGLGREMALHFTLFEAVALIATAVMMCTLILDDRCSSLKGALLVAGYMVIGYTSLGLSVGLFKHVLTFGSLGSRFIVNPEIE